MESSRGTTHFGRLLDRIRAGDPAAKDQLINDAYGSVHDLAHFILVGEFPAMRRGIETDDVVSETLTKFSVRLREGLTRVPSNPAEMFGYAATIIRSVVLDEVRKRAGPQFQTQFPPAEVPREQHDFQSNAPADGILERLAMQEAVSRLPEPKRRLIDMKFVWGMNDTEIGAEVGCDPSTVRRHIRGILSQLRDTLEPPDRNGES